MNHDTSEDRPHGRGSAGFSLAEVLVAVALLAVIILALFGLVTAGVNRAYGGKKMTEAATIAQAVMERANVPAPQDLVGGTGTSTNSVTWSKTDATTVTPAAESGSTTAIVERNAWRTLLLNSELPANSGHPARLTVTVTALPSGRTFTDAATVRVVVDVDWTEFGTRSRKARLQTFNVRTANL